MGTAAPAFSLHLRETESALARPRPRPRRGRHSSAWFASTRQRHEEEEMIEFNGKALSTECFLGG